MVSREFFPTFSGVLTLWAFTAAAEKYAVTVQSLYATIAVADRKIRSCVLTTRLRNGGGLIGFPARDRGAPPALENVLGGGDGHRR